MKKILYLVSHAQLGGAQRYILDLAKNLKNKYEITVAYGIQDNKDDISSRLEHEQIARSVIPNFKKPIGFISDIKAYFKIKKLLLELKPDIIHLCGFKASFLGSMAAKNISKTFSPKIIYTAHGWAFNRFENFLKRKYYFFVEKYTAEYKNKIICTNKIDAETAVSELKINEKKIKLINNGLDIKQYGFLPKEDAKKKLFSKISNARLPDEKTILIGSIGNLNRDKGYYYLIKALHYLIIDYGYPITAIIIGDGPEKNDLEQRIIKFHPMDYSAMSGEVSNKIILAGRISDAPELLPAFDFYVSTSLKEGFPYTILEAMGAGLPIIATKTGSVPNMITDGVNGMLIESRDSAKLAKVISNLIKDEALKKKISDNAKHDASHLFKFNKTLQETKTLYEN